VEKKVAQTAEISGGVRQGCPLAPTLFNMYINGVLSQWKADNIGGRMNKKQRNKTFFEYDKIIIAKSGTFAKKSIHALENIISKCGLTSSTRKT
jgi:hypothetical protein